MPVKLRQSQAAEPLENFEFNRALKKALSPEGYRFKIASGDEFVLFARRNSYKPGPGVHEKEEIKLDLFHVKEGRLIIAGYMDCSNTYYAGGRAESLCSYSIQWDVLDSAQDHIKEAERARAMEEALLVFDDYSVHGHGSFKGIGSFLLGFQNAYSKSRGIRLFILAEPSHSGEQLFRSFYPKDCISEVKGEIYTLFVDLSKVEIPKPEIKRV